MGYDSDHPMSEGEVGREGVAIDTLADMEALLDGIDLENISVSLTINPSAWILLAMYIALAKKRGLDMNKLSAPCRPTFLKNTWRRRNIAIRSRRRCGSCATPSPTARRT
jgi:methylmalonyl-CoA mutase N-terminal domain/subunit